MGSVTSQVMRRDRQDFLVRSSTQDRPRPGESPGRIDRAAVRRLAGRRATTIVCGPIACFPGGDEDATKTHRPLSDPIPVGSAEAAGGPVVAGSTTRSLFAVTRTAPSKQVRLTGFGKDD